MDLQTLKDQINSGIFSEESLKVMNEILDASIQAGFITEENKAKMQSIIDLEVKVAEVEAKAMEEAEMAELAHDTDLDITLNQLADDLEDSEKQMKEEISNIDTQASSN